MAIEELVAVVAPPAKPIEIADGNKWNEILGKLGISLPKELLDFALRYGTGRFRCRGVHIKVFNPLSASFYEEIRGFCDLYRDVMELSEEGSDYSVFPERPGLFPWGTDDNGSGMFWLTVGDTAEWPIVLVPHSSEEIERFETSMTTFLAKVFGNEICCALWSEPEMLAGPVVFEPTKQLHRIELD